MNVMLPIILFSFSITLAAYVVLNSILGVQAFEERKIQTRFRNLSLQTLGKMPVLTKNSQWKSAAYGFALSQYGWFQRIQDLLFLSKIKLSVAMFLLTAVLFAGAFSFGILLVSSNGWAGLLTLGVSLSAPFLYLLIREQQYLNRFTLTFPDALTMMKNAVRAGQGIQSAFKQVAEEGPYPVSVEFDRVVAEIDLGTTVPLALRHLYERIPLSDVKLFVTGISIQTEVGGNITGLLDETAKTIRERITLVRELKAMTAQGKATATLLIGVPFFLAIAIEWMNHGYFKPLIEDPLGKKVCVGVALWMCVGITIVVRMVRGVRLR